MICLDKTEADSCSPFFCGKKRNEDLDQLFPEEFLSRYPIPVKLLFRYR